MVVIHFLNEKDFPKNAENINENLGKWIKLFQKKKYIRKKNPTSVSKKKTCKCYICNEEGHYALECPKRGKSAKKMIKILEEQDFEIIYGEEISDEEEILYEISSDEESSNQ